MEQNNKRVSDDNNAGPAPKRVRFALDGMSTHTDTAIDKMQTSIEEMKETKKLIDQSKVALQEIEKQNEHLVEGETVGGFPRFPVKPPKASRTSLIFQKKEISQFSKM